MDNRTERAKEIFLDALEIGSAEGRRAFLDQACGDYAALRGEVEGLLAHHPQVGSFLDSGAQGLPIMIGNSSDEGPGCVIGPYKLLQQIGEGGMGVVWMAEQTQPVQRKVALKVIKPGMDSRQVIARFEVERQALALMDHVNIARVFDGGTTEQGRPYFVMELVHGVPITKYCDDNHLTLRERLELFVPVCQAIQHAHRRGIIHRDIKPSNVMVTLYDGKPVPKVIDFGVAKATEQKLTERTLFTHYGTMVGTLEYMSPEQAEMSALGVDTRSDIYSLGVLLYELLTGSTPLTHKRMKEAAYAEILRMIKEEEPPRPSTRLSDSGEALASISANRHTEPAKLTKLVRGELDWIVMKSLEKDRERRYETTSSFAADVGRYLNDEPVQACPPSVGYRFRKFARRNKAAFAMASVMALALIAFAVAGAFAYRHQLAEQKRLAEQKVHEERLLGVQRDNAVERALMAAMSGDFDAADKVIGEAELLGASTGHVRMLRGQIAFHRGDMEAAIQHLEQAAKLLPVGQPGAVAARAMLALACLNAHQLPRFDDLSRQLDQLLPITPEDFLFKGLFETTIHPERGLQSLGDGIRRHDSILARATRLEARANRALVSGNVEDAELALEDAQVARGMLPANPLVLARIVFAQLVAAGIYESKGRPKDSELVLAQTRPLVRTLERFAATPFAAKACFEYFEYVGDEDAAYAMSKRGSQFRLAVMLYRRGEFAKALDVAVERSRRRAPGFSSEQIERAFILAELPDGPARALGAFEEAKADARSAWQLTPPMILLLLGKREEARRAYLQVRKEELPPWDDGWLVKYLDYNCGRITAEALLKAAGEARPKVCDAHFLIGLWRLSEGDRAGSRDQLQKCIATRGFVFWEWPWARAFLARMDKDPTWPPWIPLKK
jgi:serine/threonine protein kinase/tetratricopeptide (TPR) repeat protein